MKPFLKLIIPEKAELFLYASIALGVLLLENVRRFWLFFGGTEADSLSASGGIEMQLSNWFTNAEARLDPRIADFLVWMLIGCIVFALFEYIVASIRTTDEEVELLQNTKSMRGKTQEFRTFMAKLATRIAGVIGLLFWVVIFLRAINPALSKLFFVNATSITDPISWLWIVLSVVGMALSLYIFVVAARVIMLRPRILGESEEIKDY